MRIHRRAFTLVELLVVMAIVSILMAMLLPMLGKARAVARAVQCLNNEKQQFLGFSTYVDSHRGFYPPEDWGYVPGRTWSLHIACELSGGPLLPGYGDGLALVRNSPTFRCPENRSPVTAAWSWSKDNSYGTNSSIVRCSNSPGPQRLNPLYGERASKVVLIEDCGKVYIDHNSGASYGSNTPALPSDTSYPQFRHLLKVNLVFVDGHGATLAWADVRMAYWCGGTCGASSHTLP